MLRKSVACMDYRVRPCLWPPMARVKWNAAVTLGVRARGIQKYMVMF